MDNSVVIAGGTVEKRLFSRWKQESLAIETVVQVLD
jgi:hypothetical protein